nr:hypothetical protein [uncultured Cupriavidus sp.]
MRAASLTSISGRASTDKSDDFNRAKMGKLHISSLFLSILAAGNLASAQEQPRSASSAPGAKTATTNCSKASLPKHNHSIERGAGAIAPRPCATNDAKGLQSPAKEGEHEHNKFRKNQ